MARSAIQPSARLLLLVVPTLVAADGESDGTLIFTSPVVSVVTPANGPTKGGQSVTLIGNSLPPTAGLFFFQPARAGLGFGIFDATASVSIGSDADCPTSSWTAATLMRCLLPAGTKHRQVCVPLARHHSMAMS